MFVAAINQYEEINRVVPGYYISRYYLGLTYAQAGQSAKAIETLQKFVSEAGDDPAKQAVVTKAQDLLKRLMK
jgi:cytochrome c-type biogenesis protein CcmH/NrfG